MNDMHDDLAPGEPATGREWGRAELWIVIVLAVALGLAILAVYLLGGFCGCTTRPPA